MSKNGNRKWGYLLLIASVSAIIVATIYPFTFYVPEEFSLGSVVEKFHFGSAVKDYLQNILLFIPLGIALATVVQSRSRGILSICFICLSTSAILSATVEITQLFLPIRTPNLTDIIYNTLGGIFGGLLYYWRDSILDLMVGIATADPRRLRLSSLLIAIAGYCLLVIVGIWVLSINVNLSNWNDEFYLALGNEVTGNRPWNGYIYNLSIGDRRGSEAAIAKALEREELSETFVNFDFTQTQRRSDYEDNSQHLLDLTWQNSSPLSSGDRNLDSGVLVNSTRWLKTSQPASFISKRLKQTDEFTLFFKVATNQFKQKGPARILSFSKGIYAHNLLVAQRNASLNFRLRTPITGNNATQPEFIIPQVFTDKKPHSVAIAFAANQLDFYIDNIDNKYSFAFTPVTCFTIYFPWHTRSWYINFNKFDLVRYQRNFYTIISFPLVILVSILIYFITVNKVIVNASK